MKRWVGLLRPFPREKIMEVCEKEGIKSQYYRWKRLEEYASIGEENAVISDETMTWLLVEVIICHGYKAASTKRKQ